MEELKKCQKKCERLNKALIDAVKTDGWYGNIRKHVEDALYIAEHLTLDIRKLYRLDCTLAVDENKERLADISREAMEMAIEIKSQDEIHIKLPIICSKKKYSDKYIRDSLSALLEREIRIPLMLKDRVVVIKYSYEKLENDRYCGEMDYDNIETRSIMNALTKYILFDDAPQYYQLYQCAVRGNPGTKISVYSKNQFKSWLMRGDYD